MSKKPKYIYVDDDYGSVYATEGEVRGSADEGAKILKCLVVETYKLETKLTLVKK